MAKTPTSRRRRKRSGTPGISRVDQPSTRTHGFVVRIGWYQKRDGSYGPKHKSFFGDASHGGKKGALKAAEAWRSKVERTAKRGSRRTAKR